MQDQASRKGGLNWLRELMQLQPYGENGLTKSVRGFMNIWAPLTCVFVGFLAFVWYEFGMLAFSRPFAIALAVTIPIFMLVLDVINFTKDVEKTSGWINVSRVAISLIFTLFTSLALQLSFFHGDIADLERAKIVNAAHEKIDNVWNPQIKAAEKNLSILQAQCDNDRTNLAAAQKKEMEQALRLQQDAIEAVQRNVERTSVAYNSASKTNTLRKDAEARRAAIETLQKKHAETMNALDADAQRKQKIQQDVIVNVRAQKAKEEKALQTLSNADVETKYGVVIKTGMIDQIETLYGELPDEQVKGRSAWLGIFGCFLLVFILELGPFLARNLAPNDLAEYYKKSKQDELKAEQEIAYQEICIKAEPVMQGIARWRQAADTEIERGIGTLEELNAMLRRLWTEHVDTHVVNLYIAASKKGEQGQKMLAQFLARNGQTDLQYEKRPWECTNAQAKERWSWEPRSRDNLARLPTRTHP